MGFKIWNYSWPVRPCWRNVVATPIEQWRYGRDIEVKNRTWFVELHILISGQGTKPTEMPYIIVNSFNALAGGLETLEQIPEVTYLWTFLCQLILIQLISVHYQNAS